MVVRPVAPASTFRLRDFCSLIWVFLLLAISTQLTLVSLVVSEIALFVTLINPLIWMDFSTA